MGYEIRMLHSEALSGYTPKFEIGEYLEKGSDQEALFFGEVEARMIADPSLSTHSAVMDVINGNKFSVTGKTRVGELIASVDVWLTKRKDEGLNLLDK